MKLKNIILAVFVLLTALFITIITYFAAFALTVILGSIDVTDASTATVDQGIFNLLRYTVALIIFGGWIYKVRFSEDNPDKRTGSTKDAFLFIIHPLRLLALLILGTAIQLGTDGVLYILSNAFPESFKSYNRMMAEFMGRRDVLYLITVIVMAPIVEELIFRGLMLHYLTNGVEKRGVLIFANVLQALLFALYHGSLIQGIYAFIFGLLLGFIAIKTDSLVINILLHMIINGSLYIIPEDFFISGYMALLTSAVSMVLIILLTIYLSFAISRRRSTYSDMG